jgi:branched-chain amino acid transport system ATP-binding protein
VLLLDEPAAGVPKSESSIIMRAIGRLPTDLAILFIEHDMDLVFRFAEEIVVLVAGEIMTVGTPAQISADERVKEIYFGRRQHANA